MRRNAINLKKLMRSRRAITPVISALLLIILAVAAGVVAYAYVMGWLGGATQTPGGIKGELQFDSLYASDSTENITVYVRNVGQKELTISNAYVNGEKQTFSLTDSVLSLNEVSAKIEVDPSFDLTKGVFYEVKVTCTDGTTASQSVEAK